MTDTLLPVPGWYSDGSTAVVQRWFDGMAWTEYTRPDPHAGDSRFATTSSTEPSRVGLGMSPADLDARESELLRHRVGEACRVRRGAVGAFCSALALLAVTSTVSLALQSPDELWALGGVGAAF